ncbi:MAG: HAD hydrolase-like protein, partial [Bacteroidota bacterium]
MEKLSCVIFDLDGTLTQTNQLIFAAFNHVAQQYVSKTYSPEEITAMFGP